MFPLEVLPVECKSFNVNSTKTLYIHADTVECSSNVRNRVWSSCINQSLPGTKVPREPLVTEK